MIWSVCVFPNGQGVATASADKTVKFWSFSLDKTNLSLNLVSTLDVRTNKEEEKEENEERS